MTDLLESASAWLGTMRVKHLSRVVSYRRGGDNVEVSAAIGRTEFQVDDGAGAVVSFESRDFLIGAAALVLDGDVTLPRQGDRIHETVGGTVYIYEVMAPGSEPVWRYSDPYRNTLRVHTKQVAAEQA